ncbi:MAG: hypothetical protein GWN01_13310, partial [Nitrosopumilaceae archaeon]|nr:sulfotransferase [Nitrosopumilaceae archaeon]NIX62443.1 hypothetical protein [Nitrosopumilaceae archaeon]
QIIAYLEWLFDSPFLTKNVKMSVRLPALKEIFPEAKLIRIRRNPVDIALSLLLARRIRGLEWWSVMPK